MNAEGARHLFVEDQQNVYKDMELFYRYYFERALILLMKLWKSRYFVLIVHLSLPSLKKTERVELNSPSECDGSPVVRELRDEQPESGVVLKGLQVSMQFLSSY